MIALGKEVAELGQQVSDERLRALKRIIPCSTIKSILKQTGQDRLCPRLPKWFMIWFVIGMGLFASDCYRQIFRWLQRFRPGATPGRSSLCEARQRLGVAPLRWLMEKVVQLKAILTTPDAFYRGMRLMAVDGFIVDLPDTDDNARVFSRPRNGKSEGAFPQARILALCEIGTHVLWKCLIKPMHRAEIGMTRVLLRFLDPDMLLLWDRGFLSYDNVAQVLFQGAHLLARIKKNLIFIKQKRLPDGSYRVKLYPSATKRQHDQDGIELRLIEYTFHDPARTGSGERHRLVTTLLDWRKDPAKTLIDLYHERWEEELTIDEFKTHQCQRPVLRSQTPAGVVQELYGMFLAHYVVRVLMFEAATDQKIAPRRLSFTNALKILRCRLPESPASRAGCERWYVELLQELGEEVLEPRRNRINPRVIKCKISKWLKKRPEHRRHPQPKKRFKETVSVLR